LPTNAQMSPLGTESDARVKTRLIQLRKLEQNRGACPRSRGTCKHQNGTSAGKTPQEKSVKKKYATRGKRKVKFVRPSSKGKERGDSESTS